MLVHPFLYKSLLTLMKPRFQEKERERERRERERIINEALHKTKEHTTIIQTLKEGGVTGGLASLEEVDVEKTSSTVSLESSMIMERSLPEEKGLFIGSSPSGVNKSIRSSK